jgi:L-ascorbate metabolism protein UlaG (beta-lactamase superfamily)
MLCVPVPCCHPGPDRATLMRLLQRMSAVLLALCCLMHHAGAAAQSQPPPARQRLDLPAGAPADQRAELTFIGTATMLIRFGGLTILTDPNFLHKGDKVHLGYGLTSTRLTDPAIDFDHLPPIDMVLLSHLHEDHFDRLVQQRLARNIPIITTPRAAGRLKDMGFTNTIGLGTWQQLDISKGGTTIAATSMPGRHGPAGVAALLPQVMGTMLDLHDASGRSYRMYISGDTMVYNDIAEIPRRFPDIDLAVLHLGGTRILGIVTVTMNGAEGVRMLSLLAPRHAVPVHYDDYDVFKSPLADFQREVDAAGLKDKVSYLARGDSYRFVTRTEKPGAR